MARITQAALEAAVEQAKKEGAEAGAAIIESLRVEVAEAKTELDKMRAWARNAVDEVEAKLRDAEASAKRSVENAIDHNKGGAWMDNPRAWWSIVALAALLIGLLVWSLSASAHDESGCKLAYPPGLTIVCVGGYWWIDADELPTAVRTNMKCIDRRS